MATTRLLSAMVATWNNVATTFTGLKLNVTDTASASGSLLMDLQVGGVSKASITKTGLVNVNNIDMTNTTISRTNSLRFGPNSDTILQADAANTLALRNGTAAQQLNIYETYTDASNYSRGFVGFFGGTTFAVGADATGTGTGRSVRIQANGTGTSIFLRSSGTDRWQLDGNGHFIASTDNTYDIGASGANRPRNVYVGSNIIAGSAGVISFAGRGAIQSTADAVLRLSNNAGTITTDIALSGASGAGASTMTLGGSLGIATTGQYQMAGRLRFSAPADGVALFQNVGATDFTRLILGTNDTSGIAIKKNGTQVDIRLGDDSAYANLTAAALTGLAKISVTGTTVTASAPVLDLAQTWNNGAVAFTGAKFNVTDTASASGSLLLDLQVGGVSKFSVDKTGLIQSGAVFSSGAVRSVSNSGLFSLGAASDVILARDAANVLALRNGAAAQGCNIYNTYTDASNYELGLFGWGSNLFFIGTEKAGTGVARALQIRIDGNNVWQFSTAGHFLASTDNTYDIGASGANRPRNVYVANNLQAEGGVSVGALTVASNSYISWAGGKSYLMSGASGDMTLYNASGALSTTFTVGASNLLTLNGGLKTTGATFALQTATTLTDNAAAQVATMTNGPTAGNPTKWIAINDNGTTRYIPAW